MKRDKAIKYLRRKGEIRTEEDLEGERFNKNEEKLIEEVTKKGKIFGDPYVSIDGF